MSLVIYQKCDTKYPILLFKSQPFPALSEERKRGVATGHTSSSILVGLLAMVAGVSATVLAKMLAGAWRRGSSSGEDGRDDDEAPPAGDAIAGDAKGEAHRAGPQGQGIWHGIWPWRMSRRWEKVSSCE